MGARGRPLARGPRLGSALGRGPPLRRRAGRRRYRADRRPLAPRSRAGRRGGLGPSDHRGQRRRDRGRGRHSAGPARARRRCGSSRGPPSRTWRSPRCDGPGAGHRRRLDRCWTSMSSARPAPAPTALRSRSTLGGKRLVARRRLRLGEGARGRGSPGSPSASLGAGRARAAGPRSRAPATREPRTDTRLHSDHRRADARRRAARRRRRTGTAGSSTGPCARSPSCRCGGSSASTPIAGARWPISRLGADARRLRAGGAARRSADPDGAGPDALAEGADRARASGAGRRARTRAPPIPGDWYLTAADGVAGGRRVPGAAGRFVSSRASSSPRMQPERG